MAMSYKDGHRPRRCLTAVRDGTPSDQASQECQPSSSRGQHDEADEQDSLAKSTLPRKAMQCP
eukprot:3740436-Pyramimonas_sp.AAC.1